MLSWIPALDLSFPISKTSFPFLKPCYLGCLGGEGLPAAFGAPPEPGTFLSPDYSLLLTFIYGGRVVHKIQVHSLDCRLVAEPLDPESSMVQQVVFPRPDPLEPTQSLLNQLERGILVASNSRGLFVQRLCPIPISWNAPVAPPGPGPHLLPSNKCVELFSTTYFCRGKGVPARPPLPRYPLRPVGFPTTLPSSTSSLRGTPALCDTYVL